MMAFAFYSVYAVQERGLGKFEAGIMTSVLFITQVIANPLLGGWQTGGSVNRFWNLVPSRWF